MQPESVQVAEFQARKRLAELFISANYEREFETNDIKAALNISYNKARSIIVSLLRDDFIIKRDAGDRDMFRFNPPERDMMLIKFMKGAKMRVFRAA